MKLIYLTAKKYPASTADHIFIKEMSKAFTKILGNDFTLIVAGNHSDDLNGIRFGSLGLNFKRGLSLWYLIWLPMVVHKKKLNDPETVFFSNDPNLLSVLIVWRFILRFKYKIVSDWHMLFEDWRDRFIARNSDRLIATTEHLKETIFSQCQTPKESILTAYGGVDLERFEGVTGDSSELRSRLKLPTEGLLVGYVGFYKTMGMSKGLDTMISALALIDDRKVKMVFVGGRKDEIEEYEKLAMDKGVQDRVIFVPVTISEKIALYEKAMDILVIPYPNEPHFRKYGFPMKVYEYMASKRPIIYSDLPIIAEVLSDCATSFKAGNARDLADKINYCKAKDQKIEGLADKAFDKVRSYSWERRVANIITFLKGI